MLQRLNACQLDRVADLLEPIDVLRLQSASRELRESFAANVSLQNKILKAKIGFVRAQLSSNALLSPTRLVLRGYPSLKSILHARRPELPVQKVKIKRAPIPPPAAPAASLPEAQGRLPFASFAGPWGASRWPEKMQSAVQRSLLAELERQGRPPPRDGFSEQLAQRLTAKGGFFPLSLFPL